VSKSDYSNTASRRFDEDDRNTSKRELMKNKQKEKRERAALRTRDVDYLQDIEDAL
jgi:hypothetical protein